MRLGGQIFETCETPDQWVAAARALGYRSAFCPVSPEASADLVAAYASAARQADIVIAEVGAWSNPLSPDEAARRDAVEKCKKALALADEIGARCCVNIAGSRGAKWDGPCRDDLTDTTFETMPWMYPDSADAYLALLRAIDRKAFAVHFDPVNLVCSPQRYFRNGDVIRDFIAQLGPHIRSCHAKDILLQDRLTVHLDEVGFVKANLKMKTSQPGIFAAGDVRSGNVRQIAAACGEGTVAALSVRDRLRKLRGSSYGR